MQKEHIINRLSVLCRLSFVVCPLHLSRTLYKSTLFMQNKPNFRKSKMNLNIYNTMNYEKFIPLAGQKNKPNSNPIKPNCRKSKIDAKCLFTKDYEEKCG